jgi:NAD(P)-dependent dehydrogenase (short-subunit alcohol dehydrogenase family)
MTHQTKANEAVQRYEGKTAVVTGAASGIGRAITQRLLEEGAQVCATDINAEGLKTMRHERLLNVPGDISDPRTIATVVTQAQHLGNGEIHALFNNAGISAISPAEDFEFDAWRRVMDINLDAAFRMAQGVGRIMIKQGHGAILNTASPAGIAGIPNSIAYVASKHALVGVTRALAVEWGKLGLRVNAICPGLTESGLNEQLRQEHPERWAQREQINPMRRGGQQHEQAATALFLNSDEASYTNGQIAVIDGGQDALFSGYAVAFR